MVAGPWRRVEELSQRVIRGWRLSMSPAKRALTIGERGDRVSSTRRRSPKSRLGAKAFSSTSSNQRSC
jgi:hypothetical protein